MSTILIILVLIIVTALWTVMTTRLLRSVIGLAFLSVLLSILIFMLNSPLAALFELSVCAGLISVIFFTAISFTKRLSKQDYRARQKERLKKFWILPFIILLVGIALTQVKPVMDFIPPLVETGGNVQTVMWNLRHFELLGQIVVLLAGAFGVIILFKDKKA